MRIYDNYSYHPILTYDRFLSLIRSNSKDRLNDELSITTDINLNETLGGLELAAKKALDCIPILIDHAKKLKKDKKFNHSLASILMKAVRANHIDAVKALLSFCGDDRSIFYHHKTLVRDDHEKFTVLHWAVQNNNPEMCRLLLRKWNEKNLNRSHAGNNPKFPYDRYTFNLCTAHDHSKRSAFKFAFDLGHLDCAKEIAKFHSWNVVRNTEDKETVIYQILLNNIKFGYETYVTSLKNNFMKLLLPPKITNFSEMGFNVCPLKVSKIDQVLYFSINRNKPNNERYLFLTQANNHDIFNALYYFYRTTIDPELKRVMDADLRRLTYIMRENYAPVPDSEVAQRHIEEIRQYLLEAGQDVSAESANITVEDYEQALELEPEPEPVIDSPFISIHDPQDFVNAYGQRPQQAHEFIQNTSSYADETFESAPEPIIDSHSYSIHLQNYLSSFDESKKISTQIAALKLTPEEKKLEEKLFKEFIDPISLDYIGIPVYLNEIWYDFKSICLLEKDPMTREKFSPLEIMAGRKILEKFDKAVKALQNARALRNELADSNVTRFNLLPAPPANSAETPANEMIMKQAGLRVALI